MVLGIRETLIRNGWAAFVADEVELDFDMTVADVAYWAEARERETVMRTVPAPKKGTSPVPKYQTLHDLLMLDATLDEKVQKEVAATEQLADSFLTDPKLLSEWLQQALDDE
jgi:hypothetical protein